MSNYLDDLKSAETKMGGWHYNVIHLFYCKTHLEKRQNAEKLTQKIGNLPKSQ